MTLQELIKRAFAQDPNNPNVSWGPITTPPEFSPEAIRARVEQGRRDRRFDETVGLFERTALPSAAYMGATFPASFAWDDFARRRYAMKTYADNPRTTPPSSFGGRVVNVPPHTAWEPAPTPPGQWTSVGRDTRPMRQIQIPGRQEWRPPTIRSILRKNYTPGRMGIGAALGLGTAAATAGLLHLTS